MAATEHSRSEACLLGLVADAGAHQIAVTDAANVAGDHLENADGQAVFAGQTKVNQIKRSFEELAGYLLRSQTFPNGAMLLTGTGVVPPDQFTLEPEDVVRIDISGIGRLENRVRTV